jgi:L-2-hydroxyglutarate oxidase LhgO
MDQVDCIVIGAGVVGLAIARELALAGREVIVLESADAIGTVTSSRNSEVIHAGLYYATGSLKARFCVTGRRAMYAYCLERGLYADPIGKLVVATSEAQIPKLEALKRQSDLNDVEEVDWIDAAKVSTLEPQIRCVAALWSRTSGIVDSHGLMVAFQGDLEDRGGVIAFNAPFAGGTVTADGIIVRVGGAEPTSLLCRTLVNAAGLTATEAAHAIEGMPAHFIPRQYYAKGNYFSMTGVKAPFRMLIYPMPTEASLGLHATVDRGGQVRFGPDVEWVDRPDYAVGDARTQSFYAQIRDYWPGLPDGSLSPTYAGVRPKLVGPGAPSADFVIQGPDVHGVPGLINLFGIESPGLTSSMAIGAYVRSQIMAG